ncbi:hypothetical protein HNQ00_000933 [Flavobacterium sp. 14A]|nr:hypothetical protein [Flavobacterium sp. 14A]
MEVEIPNTGVVESQSEDCSAQQDDYFLESNYVLLQNKRTSIIQFKPSKIFSDLL